MAYPPTVPPTGRTDGTALATNHPSDHNTISAALTDIINELGTSPKGDFASVQAHLAAVCPLGAVLPFAGASAPTGWGLCNGAAVSRATYADLFALIGTTYGVGDGSTTFNVPDLRSRFVAGKGTATWSDTLAETGGTKDTVLVAHEHTQPTHSHSAGSLTATQGTHAHVENTETGSTGWLYQGAYNGVRYSLFSGHGLDAGAGSTYAYAQPSTAPVSAGAITMGGTTAAEGNQNTNGVTVSTGSATDTNLPPYLTLNYIIRLT